MKTVSAIKPAAVATTDPDRYARTWHGYIGKRRVVVLDGRVTSHNGQDWHEFLAACTKRFQRRTRFQSILCQNYIRHLDQQIHSQRLCASVANPHPAHA